jgi:signal transduction histidine kinase
VGGIRPKKKFYNSPHYFTKDQITLFSRTIVAEFERVQKAKEEEINVLVHDLRALSSAIYNSAEDARTTFEAGNKWVAQQRIETVIATHTMLSIRIDMLDYSINQATNTVFDTIPVFKKVDKVVRCFRPKASARGINLELRGPSFASTYGPALFELVPYAIIDNAVKYAPTGGSIVISVIDGVTEVRVRVSSLGPYIEPQEQSKIFDRGYRGKHAVRTPQPGTGIGLSSAKKLLEEQFQGRILVSQNPEAVAAGPHAFFQTEFEIVVPTAAALSRR